MEKSVIKVDKEWAYQKVVSSHDFSDKSPDWVDSFLESWCDGFLEGYIKGRIESTIKHIYDFRCAGMPSAQIEKYTCISKDVINMVGYDDTTTK